MALQHSNVDLEIKCEHYEWSLKDSKYSVQQMYKVDSSININYEQQKSGRLLEGGFILSYVKTGQTRLWIIERNLAWLLMLMLVKKSWKDLTESYSSAITWRGFIENKEKVVFTHLTPCGTYKRKKGYLNKWLLMIKKTLPSVRWTFHCNVQEQCNFLFIWGSPSHQASALYSQSLWVY